MFLRRVGISGENAGAQGDGYAFSCCRAGCDGPEPPPRMATQAERRAIVQCARSGASAGSTAPESPELCRPVRAKASPA